MSERDRAEELAKGLIRRLFRIGEHIDAKVVWEPEKFLTDAMLAYAAERVAAERKRCAKVCRDLCLSGTHEIKRDAACVECAEAIEQEPT